MPEVLTALAVLIAGALIGSLIKPNEAQLRPMSPDEIKGQTAEPHDAHH